MENLGYFVGKILSLPIYARAILKAAWLLCYPPALAKWEAEQERLDRIRNPEKYRFK